MPTQQIAEERRINGKNSIFLKSSAKQNTVISQLILSVLEENKISPLYPDHEYELRTPKNNNALLLRIYVFQENTQTVFTFIFFNNNKAYKITNEVSATGVLKQIEIIESSGEHLAQSKKIISSRKAIGILKSILMKRDWEKERSPFEQFKFNLKNMGSDPEYRVIYSKKRQSVLLNLAQNNEFKNITKHYPNDAKDMYEYILSVAEKFLKEKRFKLEEGVWKGNINKQEISVLFSNDSKAQKYFVEIRSTSSSAMSVELHLYSDIRKLLNSNFEKQIISSAAEVWHWTEKDVVQRIYKLDNQLFEKHVSPLLVPKITRELYELKTQNDHISFLQYPDETVPGCIEGLGSAIGPLEHLRPSDDAVKNGVAKKMV